MITINISITLMIIRLNLVIINYKYIYNSYDKWFKFSYILDLVSGLV